MPSEDEGSAFDKLQQEEDQANASIRDTGYKLAHLYGGMIEGGMTRAQAGQAVAHFGYILLLDVGKLEPPAPGDVHAPEN